MGAEDPFRFVFVIQGEGRGHFTQAIALYEELIAKGHTVTKCFIGKSSHREIPQFVIDRLSTQIETFESPNFIRDRANKGIRVGRSIAHHLFRLHRHVRTSRWLLSQVEKEQPRVVVNFYEPLLGFGQLFRRLSSPVVCIAHQYLSIHRHFRYPKGRSLERTALKTLTFISQIGSVSNLALSFYDFPDDPIRKINVVPPLLRHEVRVGTSNEGKFFLVYLLNTGYAQEVIKWHKAHPEIRFECFWDGEDDQLVYEHPNLTFHKLSDHLFIEKMQDCSALVTTAGFESVCEAMYLGKPVMMVPVEGHYEQFLNAFDAVNAGAGVSNNKFDLTELTEKLNQFNHSEFAIESSRTWIASGIEKVTGQIEKLINK